MNLLNYILETVPESIRKITDHVLLWGSVITGLLGIIQPWLTAIATILAISWTSIQIYFFFKKKRNG